METLQRSVERSIPRFPCLGRRLWMSDHVFGNGSFRDFNAEFLKFAADARRGPKSVVTAHLPDEIASFLRNLRTAGSPMTSLPGPIPPEPLAVPGNDGFRSNHNQGGTPIRPPA